MARQEAAGGGGIFGLVSSEVVPDTAVYQLMLVLHLVTVIAGFGSVAMDGAYRFAAPAERGADGPTLSEWLIYAVPVTGILVVLVSEDRWQFSQAWISLSFLLYIAAVGALHGLRRRNPAAAAAAVNLIVVAVIVLMVTKPGA